MATTRKGGTYGATAVSEELLAASTVQVEYVPVGAASSPTSEARPAGSVAIRLAPASALPAVPGSVRFVWMGQTYTDNGAGLIFRGAAGVDPGVQSGTMNYATCTAHLDDWVVGPNPGTVTVQRLWTRRQLWTTGVIYGRTASAPVKPGAGGLVLTAADMAGDTLTATVDATGEISGDQAWGAIDFATGAFQIMFGEFVADASLTAAEKAEWWYDAAEVGAVEPGQIWRPRAVDPTSLRYNAVTYVYLPIEAELMGITPERLPPDGRMPFVRPGMYAVIGLTIDVPAFTPSVGMTINLGQTLLSSIDVLDAAGTGQVATGHTVDLDAGTLTINDITGWPAQVTVRGRAEVYRRVQDVTVDGRVRLTTPIGRAFPAGAVLSTAARFGNKSAYVERTFDQQAFDGVTWANVVTGNVAPASYDFTGHPVEMNNRGAVTERWALKFRNDGVTFDLIGEHLGQIAAGTINSDFEPPNPQAGNAPYFTLRALGWGSGWAPGNTLFIHTQGAEMPLGVIRSTNPGSSAGIDYSAVLEIRGDKDRPPSNPFTS